MLISIPDSVSREVSGMEAVAVTPDGLSGDLNAEDLDSHFLLIWPRKNLNLLCIKVCRSVLITAAFPDFLWVSLHIWYVESQITL